ncbi:MAG: TonB-dependent receptor [Acidobacteria bacterium]|nr:TonB-dependent receptor [Acidobacteriota bacterium]
MRRFLFLTVLCGMGSLPAQLTTGAISGYVLDPSGRAIANAEVVASDPARALHWTAVTDATGLYRFVELAPAAYELTASAPAMEKATVRGVTLAVDSRRVLDFHLQVAGKKEAVDVTGSLQPVDSQASELGTVFDRGRIESLPLNRRDFLQLALLTPGVLAPVEDSELSSRGSVAMHANGGREEYNNFLLDGVDNNDPNVNRYVLQPSVDTVQEFKISTNSYSAEYGRSGAGQVSVITRRGANDFHGFAYEYLRNREMDARNFFAGAAPQFQRNQFGAGAGGPILKNRSFFFANLDLLRERRGLSRLASVPTPELRRGNLASLGSPVVDPFSRAPFPGGVIPSNRISPVALRVLTLFPLPNRPGLSGNYLPNPVQREDQSMANVRVDHQLSGKDQLSFRYSFGLFDSFEPYAEDTATIPGFGNFVRDPGHNAMIHHQRVISPRTVQSLRLGFGRFSRAILPENHLTDAGKVLGVDWLRLPPLDFGFPVFNVAGFSRIGDATTLPIVRHTNTYQLIEGLSLVRGNHVYRVGGEVRHLQLNGILDLLTRGSLSFSGVLSNSGISDLLLGLPSFGLQAQSDNPQTLRSTSYNLYFQDDWKLRPSFTLNLGMRYEYNTPPTDPTNRMSTLNSRTGRVVRAGTEGTSRSGIHADHNNLAPRLGFAWTPTRDLVIRGGYGLYFDSGMFVVNSAQYFNPPQFNLRIFFPTQTSLLTLQDPFPARGGITPPPSLNILSPDVTGAYMQHWNLSLQHPVKTLGVLNLSYAGSKGTHLIHSRDTNQPAPAPGDVQARRPNPAYGGIFFVESGANSSFHSLQASFNRPLARSLSLWTAYTFSKSIDDTSAFLGTKADKNFPQDSRNYAAERGLSSFDVRHRLTLAHTYALPRTHWLTKNVELRGITTLQSGQPFTPILRFDNSNTGNTGGNLGSDRPNLLRDPALSQRSPDRWFDPRAFAIPARYTFGSAGRNIVRGPGLFAMDLSLARRFPLRENSALAFEAQAFNLLHRANFELPELLADEPTTFGRIFAAKAPRQLQFSLRLTF